MMKLHRSLIRIIKDIKSRLPPHLFYIGDEGFVNTSSFLTPIGGNALLPAEDGYNYYLSRMRQNVERAFGLMVRKWGVFWKPLQCANHRWNVVIRCRTKLNNFCIDERLRLTHDNVEPWESGSYNDSISEEDIQLGDIMDVLTDQLIWYMETRGHE
jgi:hypothetical protein